MEETVVKFHKAVGAQICYATEYCYLANANGGTSQKVMWCSMGLVGPLQHVSSAVLARDQLKVVCMDGKM